MDPCSAVCGKKEVTWESKAWDNNWSNYGPTQRINWNRFINLKIWIFQRLNELAQNWSIDMCACTNNLQIFHLLDITDEDNSHLQLRRDQRQGIMRRKRGFGHGRRRRSTASPLGEVDDGVPIISRIQPSVDVWAARTTSPKWCTTMSRS
jgi:hypothetical protein